MKRGTLGLIMFTSVLIVAAGLPFAQASTMTTVTLSTASPPGGLHGGGDWATELDGFQVTATVSHNGDGSWHYKYVFSDEMGEPVIPATSHFIIGLSQNISTSDLWNFSGDLTIEDGENPEYPKTFMGGSGDPGWPDGGSLYGIKIELSGEQAYVEFDSSRMPQWTDFYGKGGNESYVYNTDFGETVANPNDYTNQAVAASGNPLFKILGPDTLSGPPGPEPPGPGPSIIPEPATAVLAGLGLLSLLGWRSLARRHRRRRRSGQE